MSATNKPAFTYMTHHIKVKIVMVGQTKTSIFRFLLFAKKKKIIFLKEEMSDQLVLKILMSMQRKNKNVELFWSWFDATGHICVQTCACDWEIEHMPSWRNPHRRGWQAPASPDVERAREACWRRQMGFNDAQSFVYRLKTLQSMFFPPQNQHLGEITA